MISAENVDEGPAASCWLWMEEPPSGSSAFWVDVGLTKMDELCATVERFLGDVCLLPGSKDNTCRIWR